MTLIRRLFLSRIGPDLLGSSVINPVMTSVGVFTFLAGAFYLPSLGPTRIEMIFGLLLLASVVLLCTAVGQLSIVVERLERKNAEQNGSRLDYSHIQNTFASVSFRS